MKTVCYVPVYNQLLELPCVLQALRDTPLACDTVLLVNNGSNDGSEKLIRESGYEYIDIPQNLGVGHSTIRAIEWALERNYDIFTGIASNGKMLPSEMHRVVDPVRDGRADYVTGSRFLPGGDSPNLPSFRRSSIPMVNIFVKLLTGQTLTDATCGYRAFRLDMMRQARFDWRAKWLYTYGLEYYLYAKVIMSEDLRWIEVPITMRYPTKGNRYTKIKPFKGWYDMLLPWVIARVDGRGFVR